MSDRKPASAMATAQEIGGAADGRLHESVRAGTLRTGAGDRVHLAVVAKAPAGSSDSEKVVEQLFQTIERSNTRDYSAALRRGLEIAGQSFRGRSDEALAQAGIEAAAIVIWKQKLFFAQFGGTLGIRVSKGKASRLTGSSDPKAPGSQTMTSPSNGLTLLRGDRVVLISDGILGLDPETGRAYVAGSEIAQHVTELPPTEAARHLVSLALGRDVDANVSLAVLAMRGRAQPARRPLVPLVAAAAVALVALAIVAVMRRPTADDVSDYGFAVLVEGGVIADEGLGLAEPVDTLGAISSAALVSASTDARLVLQTTLEGNSDLANGNLYLEQGAVLRLSAIDARSADEAEFDGDGVSVLELQGGKLLVVRSGGIREYRVLANGPTASMIGAGPGAMGVEVSGATVILNCFIGTCRIFEIEVEDPLLQSGERIIIRGNLVEKVSDIPDSIREIWDGFCGECLSGP